MDNKDEQAFPSPKQILGQGQDYHEINEKPGLTKREYFVAHAPNKIPDWFIHIPDGEIPQLPSWMDISNEGDRATVQDWQRDPCWDLPEHLQWFSEKLNKAVELRKEWINADKGARFFQWRSFFADALLLQLSTPQP